MFIDGLYTDDKTFGQDAENLSKYMLAGMVHYQNRRPPEIQDGKVTTHVIIAAVSFAVGVLIKDLPARERKKLREYMVHKLDDMLSEHGA